MIEQKLVIIIALYQLLRFARYSSPKVIENLEAGLSPLAQSNKQVLDPATFGF